MTVELIRLEQEWLVQIVHVDLKINLRIIQTRSKSHLVEVAI